MRHIKIVSDSASDLLSLKGVDFAYAPMKIVTDQREFIDNADLNVTDMVTFLDSYKGRSQSSCPNVTDWLNIFGDADHILCLTITGALSGSYNTACTAKRLYEDEHKDRRVTVIDTLSAGPEIVLMLERAAELVQAGRSYEEVCAEMEAYTARTGLLFMLKSLKNFANNGRVSPAVARLVGLVGICVVGKASDEGTLEPVHKVRGETKALATLMNDLRAHGWQKGKIRIAHCQNPAAAQRFREMLLADHPLVDVEISELRGLCSFYAEKGGLLIGFEKN